MTKTPLRIWIFLMLICLVATLYLFRNNLVPRYFFSSLPSSIFQDYQHIRMNIGHRTYTMEVVVSPSAQAQGLSGRADIGSDGLVFLFPQPKFQYFWMKDMQFPLDLVWISQGKVMGVTPHVLPDVCHENGREIFTNGPEVPTDDTTDNALKKSLLAVRPCADRELQIYVSPQEVEMVLEVHAGKAEEMGLMKGAEIHIQ